MTITETRSTLPAVVCAPWCSQGDGHTAVHHPEDQYCISEEQRVELASAMPLAMWQGKPVGRQTVDVYRCASATPGRPRSRSLTTRWPG